MSPHNILALVALICFGLALADIPKMVPLGLFFLTLALMFV